MVKRLALIVYFIIVIIVFGRALIPGSDQLLYGDDVHRQYYFFRVYFLDSLKQGIVPWWNPYVFSGVPFLANAQVTMQYPLNWLYVLLPLNIAYSWYFALHIFIAMISMYWFMRKFISPFPAWVSGLIFGLSGYFFARTLAGQPDVVASAAYIPLVVGLFHELVSVGGRKNVVLAAFALGWQALVGYQIVTLFTLEAVGIMTVVWSFKELRLLKSLKLLKRLIKIPIAVILGLGLAAVQILPATEFFRRSIRAFDLPYSFASSGSLGGIDLITLINPYALGDYRFYSGSPPNWHEHIAFVGITALLLAISAVLYIIFRRPKVGLDKLGGLALIGIISLWVAFASQAPIDLYYLLWRIFPPFHYIRIPSRQLILFVFALAGLAGYTFSLLKHKSLKLLIVGLILFELVPFARGLVKLDKLPQTRQDQNLVKLLQSDKDLVRLLPNFGVWLPPRDELDFQSPMQYRYFSTTGYDPSILKNYYEFIDAANGKLVPSVLDHNVQVPYLDEFSPYVNFLNIRYILNPSSSDPLWQTTDKRFQLVREDLSAGYRLYENNATLPRFFLVHDARVVPDRGNVTALIRSKSVNLSKTVLFTESSGMPGFTPCSSSTSGRVDVLSYQVNEINLVVDTPCSGYLVSSEVWYPGWQGAVDGKPSAVLEANLAFRALYIPDGKHEIKLYYRPTVFLIGGFICLAAIIICVWLLRTKP